jgi:hypothetical protein
MLLLLWMLVTYGVADVVAKSRIGAPLRRRFPVRAEDGPGPDDKRVTVAHLVHCPKCMGWWVALLLTPLHLGPAEALPSQAVLESLAPWASAFAMLAVRGVLNAFAGAALCWILHVLLCKLGAEQL